MTESSASAAVTSSQRWQGNSGADFPLGLAPSSGGAPRSLLHMIKGICPFPARFIQSRKGPAND
jgi:hypothetical protein